MKKVNFVFIFLFLLICLVGCTKKSPTELKVIMPSGAPTIAQAAMEQAGYDLKDGNTYTVERVADPSLLASAFSTKSHDIIYAPINLGAKFYNNNAAYVMAAGITWGNLFFVTTDTTDFTINSLNGKTIYCFGQGSINELVVNTLLTENNVVPSEIIWLAGTSDTKDQLVSIKQDSIVLIAEPSFTAAKAALTKAGKTVAKIDVQELWNSYSGVGSYLQAAVFVNKNTLEKNKTAVSDYLSRLADSCAFANTNPLDVSNYCTQLKYGLPAAPVLSVAIPNCHIEFKKAREAKAQIEKMTALNIAMFGGKQLDEGFFAF